MKTTKKSSCAEQQEKSKKRQSKVSVFTRDGMLKKTVMTDVLVVGGGPAGIAAALMAARSGAKTIIVERYGRLGGMGVTSLVAPITGWVRSAIVDEIIKRLDAKMINWASHVDFASCDIQYADILLQEGVTILLHTWAHAAIKKDGKVTGVTTVSKEGSKKIMAKIVVDASADGDIAFSAGVPFEMGRESDGLLQPMSVMYRLGGVDKSRAFLCCSEEEAKSVKLPEGTLEEVTRAANTSGELPKNIGVIRIYESDHDHRVINATQVNYVDGTKVADLTTAELESRRQAFVVTAFLKKHAPGYEQAYISEMPATIGVRETRRFRGMEYLTRDDVLAGRKWDTAVVREATFPIDIHNPDGGGQAEGLAANVQPYDIPYGCLVPRKIDGLLLAGRIISGSHDAHASYRQQKILMAVGAAAGAAAALCTRQKTKPRLLDVPLLQKTLGVQK